jgi:hypothetical protein
MHRRTTYYIEHVARVLRMLIAECCCAAGGVLPVNYSIVYVLKAYYYVSGFEFRRNDDGKTEL